MFLLCAVDIFSKYVWVVSSQDKKGIAITNTFQNVLNKSGRKPNKIWIDKGSKFYNRSMKSWLHDNSIKLYSTNNEGKYVIAERSVRTSETKIYKYMT